LEDTEHVDRYDKVCFVDSLQPCSVATSCTPAPLELSLNSSCSFALPIFKSMCWLSPSKPRNKTGSALDLKSCCRTYPLVDDPISCMLDVTPLCSANHQRQTSNRNTAFHPRPPNTDAAYHITHLSNNQPVCYETQAHCLAHKRARHLHHPLQGR
jgi:hypothetical protein